MPSIVFPESFSHIRSAFPDQTFLTFPWSRSNQLDEFGSYAKYFLRFGKTRVNDFAFLGEPYDDVTIPECLVVHPRPVSKIEVTVELRVTQITNDFDITTLTWNNYTENLVFGDVLNTDFLTQSCYVNITSQVYPNDPYVTLQWYHPNMVVQLTKSVTGLMVECAVTTSLPGSNYARSEMRMKLADFLH